MNTIYIFSGLGADQRALQAMDFGTFDVHYIQWIEPTEGESIGNYAGRLLSQIKVEKPVLIGLSFGGMIAVEVAKLIDQQRSS